MGCCQSSERFQENKRNNQIDTQIKRDRVNLRSEIKMLLLGTYIFIYFKSLLLRTHIITSFTY